LSHSAIYNAVNEQKYSFPVQFTPKASVTEPVNCHDATQTLRGMKQALIELPQSGLTNTGTGTIYQHYDRLDGRTGMAGRL